MNKLPHSKPKRLRAAFRKRIRQAIANPVLQAALDANAQRRVEGSLIAFQSLPDHQERRQRAHQVRGQVIADLSAVAAQFLAKAEANGFIIHRANDADEAVQIILNIVGANGIPNRLIAKSKSMVSEEIGINEALENAGHRVVETDLGEYIVQLRHEKPSHIITPAVHLRRQEVAQLFHKELGVPYTEDIPTLTNIARKKLRDVFLSADVGMSGVNFGVAESGALCIVTNEGNGRMVATLPRTHIALMGMERLVPTMSDLSLMLSLLPRSATTQKISVYTQFVQQPLPGQERHLVFLDNGRSRLRGSPINDALMCIRCGACLNVCPIFREIGGHAYNSVYPGPIGSVISAGLFGSQRAPLAQACSVCGACKDACPIDIDLPKMLLRVRAGQYPSTDNKTGEGLPFAVKFGLGIYRRIALRPRLFAAAQKWMGRITSPIKRDFIPVPAWTGWGYSKDFPRPAEKSFREMWRSEKRNRTMLAQKTSARKSQTPTYEPPSLITPDILSPINAFIKEATALRAKIISVTATEMPEKLSEFLRQRNLTHVHVEASLTGLLKNAGVIVHTEADPNITVGITRAIAAAAETGSLLVTGDNRDVLGASLLPNVHIAILRAESIYQTLDEVLALPAIAQARAAALISGPSRTADIEMTLTIGVHGPEELVVFLIDG